MLGEATLDVSGTFAGEAIRVLILFAAQHNGAEHMKNQLAGCRGRVNLLLQAEQ